MIAAPLPATPAPATDRPAYEPGWEAALYDAHDAPIADRARAAALLAELGLPSDELEPSDPELGLWLVPLGADAAEALREDGAIRIGAPSGAWLEAEMP